MVGWGCFVKSGKWGTFFCKKWAFPQRMVHYVQYQYFLVYILFIWECVHTQRTPLPTGLNAVVEVTRTSRNMHVQTQQN